MKKYFLLLLLAGAASAALAQDGNKAPYETKSLANDAIKQVDVKTSGGGITVSGEAGQEPRVEVYVKSGNGYTELTKEEIKKRLNEDYEFSISVSNHELHAIAKRRHDGNDGGWNKNLSISFKIYVPKQVATNLNTSGGSIRLDNLQGEENFTTSGGSLHLESLTGIIKGQTSGGSIEVANSGDDIKLETSGGSIKAENCKGKIFLETSGGSLHLTNLKGDIKANTSGGSITASDIEGELVTGTSGGSVNLNRMACSLEASTNGGSMNVDMLHTGKYLKLDVSGGHVNLTLPSKQGMNLDFTAERISTSKAKGFTGEWEKTRVKGSLNGGGTPVHVDASGHLEVSFN